MVWILEFFLTIIVQQLAKLRGFQEVVEGFPKKEVAVNFLKELEEDFLKVEVMVDSLKKAVVVGFLKTEEAEDFLKTVGVEDLKLEEVEVGY